MTTSYVKELLQKTPGIEVLVALVNIDPESLDPSDRVDYLAALERQSGWLQALMQIAIVAVAGSEPSPDRGRYSFVDDPQREEIASTLNLAPVTAQSRIDVARVLTQHLPATCAALSNGEISSAQATVIAKESATLLRRGIHPDQLRYLESTAIAFSEFHTPAQVTHKVRSIVAKMEPAEFEVQVAQAAEGRRVTLTAQPHGMAQILALLPAAEAQTVWLAIEKMARASRDREESELRLSPSKDLDSAEEIDRLSTSASSSQFEHEAGGLSTSVNSSQIEDEAGGLSTSVNSSQIEDEAGGLSTGASSSQGDQHVGRPSSRGLPKFISSQLEPLTLDQLRADALAALAEKFLSSTSEENLSHGRPVTLNLTLDLPTLLGLQENPGILAGYGEIPASAARQLASDAKWRRFITDPITGNLLDYGRSSYEPPQPLVDFIVARDRRCRFPGCRQPSRVCDIDHAIPWEEGGKTSKENLGLLCRRHHRMKTHGGWRLTSFEDGSCEWRSPEGKVFKVEARRIDEVA